MASEMKGRRGRTIASAAAALILAGGITACGSGLQAGGGNPAGAPAATASAGNSTQSTPTAQAGSAAPTAAPDGPPAPAPANPSVLPVSVPVSVDVPAIGVTSPLMQLGKQDNGEVGIPPGEPGSPAGWYNNSPVPGQAGSAIILGHVNSTKGPVGVFYRLHELAAGEEFTVTLADRTASVFTVDRVETYRKASFPTVEVYRNADRPEVRLITCGGYDPATGDYLDNTVVYAHLTASRPA
ncbi:hypothetical protein BJG92_02868 [Arthrobacter sp. SO5]|nr:hypothetical protein [Arthrobacter sp. SO5]